MRKSDLIHGVEQLVGALAESALELPLVEVARLGYRREPVPGELLTRLLSALREYGLRASRYTRPARMLAEELGLSALEQADTWSLLIAAENRAQEAFGFAERVRFATQHLPRVAGLLAQEGVPALDALRRGGTASGNALLTIQVIEAPRRWSTPARLATLLDGVDQLYGACATLQGLDPGGLSVVGCDAGTDKTFELMGAAPVIDAVRELILALWDRVVFYRELTAAQRYRQAAESLPVLQRVREALAEGRISPEQAELLRRRFVEGAGKFLVAGATIPELQERAYANPRTLMAPAPKLLSPAAG
ncbi:hypothetical protein [Longimicrobium terrae]|uniref:Uncharacterized protein n=1 Tax=Longimicrobium terrae TaxID=1639882 RepID=A0A841GY58_9BACT|nr:hypothetical protein [Longimicrobium terrae]MBB4636288.1 hypothetical protein [Longimicrobium terrae]MBB6070684.1 hypothetical protein [Longimicrobium terrae]NNC29666.1 hypothetical protein [Longimicrobium terrae]